MDIRSEDRGWENATFQINEVGSRSLRGRLQFLTAPNSNSLVVMPGLNEISKKNGFKSCGN